MSLNELERHTFLFHINTGPKRDFKDKEIMARKNVTRRRKLERWEESLMRATTFSQVSYYSILC